MTGLERVELLRRDLRTAAAELADAGIPAELIVDEARLGIRDAVERRSRSGR